MKYYVVMGGFAADEDWVEDMGQCRTPEEAIEAFRVYVIEAGDYSEQEEDRIRITAVVSSESPMAVKNLWLK